MRLIISGSSGFVGRRLLAQLDECDIKYTRLYRNLNDNSFKVDEINNCTDSTYIHLAGLAHKKRGSLSYEDFDQANRKIILEAVPKLVEIGVSRIIYISSIGVYGKSSCLDGEIDESLMCKPVEPYALSKYRAEQDLIELSRQFNFQLIILRPALVYGNDAPGNINRLTNLFRYCPVVIFGCNKNKRAFLNIDLLVEVIIKVSFINVGGIHVFNVADEKPISCSLFYRLLGQKINKRVFILNLPRFLWFTLLRGVGKRKLFEQLFGDFVVNSKKIRSFISQHDGTLSHD